MRVNEQRLEDAAEPVCDGQGSGTMDDVPGGEIVVLGDSIGYWLWLEGIYDLDGYVDFLVQEHKRMEAKTS